MLVGGSRSSDPAPATARRSLTTGANQTELWIHLADDDDEVVEDPPGSGEFKPVHNPPDYQPGRDKPCVDYDFNVSGTETCFDDIGLFEASDLNRHRQQARGGP